MTQKTKNTVLAILAYYLDSASAQEEENAEWAQAAYDEVKNIVPID